MTPYILFIIFGVLIFIIMYSLRKHHEGFTLTNYGTSPTSSSREGIKSIVAMLNTDMTDGTYVKNTGDAYLPKASQSSMVPKDTGASISSNPLKSTPQPTDVAATTVRATLS